MVLFGLLSKGEVTNNEGNNFLHLDLDGINYEIEKIELSIKNTIDELIMNGVNQVIGYKLKIGREEEYRRLSLLKIKLEDHKYRKEKTNNY